MKNKFFIFIFLFSTFAAQAQILITSGMTHGGELEFTNNTLYSQDSKKKHGIPRGKEIQFARLMEKRVAEKCKQYGCREEIMPGKWGDEKRIIMPDGWWFQISWDPLCVEIKTKRSTLQKLYQQEAKMQDLIFESAKEVGLEPRANRSSHTNTGIRSAFGNNLMAFFKYFVDNANHPELASGILRQNWDTAPPLSALGYDPTEIIQSIYDRIVSGEISSYKELGRVIETELYFTHPNAKRFIRERNQDLNVKNLADIDTNAVDLPFERRGNRAARSFFEFILQIELQESRIQWTKKHKGPIPFINLPAQSLTPALSYQRFLAWLAEMNLKKERYLELVPSEFKNSCVLVVNP